MTTPPSFQPASKTPRKSPHFRGISWRRSSVSVATVTLLSGLLFGMSAANARHGNVSSGELVELVRHRNNVVEDLDGKTSELQDQVNALIAFHGVDADQSGLPQELVNETVTGSGITITLTDAPPGPIPENAKPDDLVIHQQDIENVMNAMWAGGAEHMTVQGKRVGTRTEIRCIGNVIYIDGASYSPPYVISAIGNVERMLESVNSDQSIQVYQAYVAAYGLGWRLDIEDSLEMAAAHTEPPAQYAQVMENNG